MLPSPPPPRAMAAGRHAAVMPIPPMSLDVGRPARVDSMQMTPAPPVLPVVRRRAPPGAVAAAAAAAHERDAAARKERAFLAEVEAALREEMGSRGVRRMLRGTGSIGAALPGSRPYQTPGGRVVVPAEARFPAETGAAPPPSTWSLSHISTLTEVKNGRLKQLLAEVEVEAATDDGERGGASPSPQRQPPWMNPPAGNGNGNGHRGAAGAAGFFLTTTGQQQQQQQHPRHPDRGAPETALTLPQIHLQNPEGGGGAGKRRVSRGGGGSGFGSGLAHPARSPLLLNLPGGGAGRRGSVGFTVSSRGGGCGTRDETPHTAVHHDIAVLQAMLAHAATRGRTWGAQGALRELAEHLLCFGADATRRMHPLPEDLGGASSRLSPRSSPNTTSLRRGRGGPRGGSIRSRSPSPTPTPRSLRPSPPLGPRDSPAGDPTPTPSTARPPRRREPRTPHVKLQPAGGLWGAESIMARIDPDTETYQRHMREAAEAKATPREHVARNKNVPSRDEMEQQRRARRSLGNEKRRAVGARAASITELTGRRAEEKLQLKQQKVEAKLAAEEAARAAHLRAKMWRVAEAVAGAARGFAYLGRLTPAGRRRLCLRGIYSVAILKLRVRAWRRRIGTLASRMARKLAKYVLTRIYCRSWKKTVAVRRVAHILREFRKNRYNVIAVKMFVGCVRRCQEVARQYLVRQESQLALLRRHWERARAGVLAGYSPLPNHIVDTLLRRYIRERRALAAIMAEKGQHESSGEWENMHVRVQLLPSETKLMRMMTEGLQMLANEEPPSPMSPTGAPQQQPPHTLREAARKKTVVVRG